MDFLNEPLIPPNFHEEPLFADNISAALNEIVSRPVGDVRPPDYIEPLNRLNRGSEAANEELRAVNAKLDKAKDEIKSLNETVVQLRHELDEERKRAAQAEKDTKKFSALVAILGASLGVLLSMIVSLCS